MYKMGEDPRYLSMWKRYRAKKGGVVKVNTQKIDWSKADLSKLRKTKSTYRIKLSRNQKSTNLDIEIFTHENSILTFCFKNKNRIRVTFFKTFWVKVFCKRLIIIK